MRWTENRISRICKWAAESECYKFDDIDKDKSSYFYEFNNDNSIIEYSFNNIKEMRQLFIAELNHGFEDIIDDCCINSFYCKPIKKDENKGQKDMSITPADYVYTL